MTSSWQWGIEYQHMRNIIIHPWCNILSPQWDFLHWLVRWYLYIESGPCFLVFQLRPVLPWRPLHLATWHWSEGMAQQQAPFTQRHVMTTLSMKEWSHFTAKMVETGPLQWERVKVSHITPGGCRDCCKLVSLRQSFRPSVPYPVSAL